TPGDRIDCEWERYATQLAGHAGIPVPGIPHERAFERRPYLVTEWSPGVRQVAAIRYGPHLSPDLRHQLGRMQAELHAVCADSGLRRNWIDWPVAAPARIRDRLMELALDQARLLHLDFHPENVLTDGHRITAVLDWTSVHAGDPRADLART